MTYRAGFSPRMSTLGFDPGPPHVICDGCGARKDAVTKMGIAPMWLLKRKAPPGWLLIRREQEDGSVFRKDYCPSCKAEVKP